LTCFVALTTLSHYRASVWLDQVSFHWTVILNIYWILIVTYN